MKNILSKFLGFLGGIKLYLIIAASAAITIYWAYSWAYDKGKSACELEQAKAVIEHQNKARKVYESIDRASPDGTDKRKSIEWLRQFTTHPGE